MEECSEPNGDGEKVILFVDDEPLSLKYFKASVERYAKVLTAANPEAAMKILAENGDSISVVVSDERMPYDSGVSFLSTVRKSWPSTIRVLTSAYANIENLQQAINGAAIYRFVPKPWDLDELCQAMQEALVAERTLKQLAIPPSTIAGANEAEVANLELLVVLARELAVPLESIDNDAFQLALHTGPTALARPEAVASHLATWSSQLRLGQIGETAARLRRDVQHCQSLAGSIAELATGLRDASAVQTPSMAETASDVLEQIALRRADRKSISFDARQDFRYRAPKPIMKFVLVNLLNDALQRASGQSSTISVELVRYSDFNEVRITTTLDEVGGEAGRGLAGEFDRATRCALWAFGGELVCSTDATLNMATVSVRLPRTETSSPSSASH